MKAGFYGSPSFARTMLAAMATLTFLLGLIALDNLTPRAATDQNRFEAHAINSASPRQARKADKKTQRRVAGAYARLPLRFEANRGQTDSRVRFISRGSGYALFLTPSEAVLSLRTGKQNSGVDVLRMKLEGGNAEAQVAGIDEMPTKINYFIGNDPQQWHSNVPNYSRVKYENVYSGIDLIYYGNQGQLEYDFVISPGSDPKAIALRFDGADKLRVDGRGDLVLRMQAGEIRQPRPLIYQESNGARQIVSGHYALRGDSTVGFEVGRYDPAKPLIIDPVLSYSTYLGGTVNNGNEEQGFGIAVDDSGCAYITGRAESSVFPTAGSLQAYGGGTADAFVTKLNAAGDTLVYSTFLGGSGNDEGHSIAVDSSGSAYVTGPTNSRNYPTANAFQPTPGGGISSVGDAFVTKLTPEGNALVYSTYLGGGPFQTGNGDDKGEGIAVDALGNAYVTGSTLSDNFPTLNCFQCTRRGVNDTFVTKFDPAGGLVFSTYFGGANDDRARGIAVDSTGNVHIAGSTASTDLPTANALQPALGGNFDAFVAKFNATGTGLIFSTYLGGSGSDNRGTVAEAIAAITLDADGNVYLAGTTSSTNFPVVNAYQSALRGTSDAYVAKISPTGGVLLYSTYVGGADSAGRLDQAFSIALDCADNILITGLTATRDFPTTTGAISAVYGGDPGDAFLVKLNLSHPPASQLLYSTYLGGDNTDRGRSLAVDREGSAYITGLTGSSNFPTASPFQSSRAGLSDAFVSKIAFQADLAITMSASPDPLVKNSNISYTITVTNNGPDTATKIVVSDDLPSVIDFLSCSSNNGGVCGGSGNNRTVSFDEIAAGGSATITIAATTSCAVTGSLANTATVESCSFDPSSANNSATLSVPVADPPPAITCAGNITQSAPSNACSTMVSFADPTVTDNCPGTTSLCSPPSGAVFPVGTTTVTCTATDSSGNTASCSLTVTVIDTQPPVISCPAGSTAQTNAGCEATVPDVTSSVTASDNCGASGSLTITQSPAAGALVGPGTHTITATATDAAGNSASCTTILTVVDATPPTVACPGAVTVSVDAGCQASIPNVLNNVTASDGCTPSGSLSKSQSPAAGTSAGVGSHTVTVTVTDAAGNSNSCTTSVNVVDTTPPQVSCPAPSTVSVGANCSATVPNISQSATASDNCTPATSLVRSQTPAPGAAVGAGVHTITVTVRDASGNAASCTTTLTVVDAAPPTITACASNKSITANASGQAAIPNLTAEVSAADNCSVASITQSPAAGTMVGTGSTTVVITVRDAAGNAATCSAVVTVTGGAPAGDGDGIADAIDRNPSTGADESRVFSNNFLRRTFASPAIGPTSGRILERAGRTFSVTPEGPSGVQVAVSGTGGIAKVRTRDESPVVLFDTAGQTLHLTSNYRTQYQTCRNACFSRCSPVCRTVTSAPTNRFRAVSVPGSQITLEDTVTDFLKRHTRFVRVGLEQGQTVYLGSLLTADATNNGNARVSILDQERRETGSLELAPGQTIDVIVGPQGEIIVINLGTESLTVTANGVTTTLNPGQTNIGSLSIKKKVLDDLVALRGTSHRDDGEKIDQVIKALRRAVEADQWFDEIHLQPHSDERVFRETKTAVDKLRQMMRGRRSSIPNSVLQGFIDRIVTADRLLALTAIDDASALGGRQDKVSQAREYLADGDDDAREGRPASAIEHYGYALRKAMESRGDD